MGLAVGRRAVLRLGPAGESVRRTDSLAGEEPLEIRIGGRPLAVTMRTPGDDVDLALGFLLSEGIIRTAGDVRTARLCAGDSGPGRGVLAGTATGTVDDDEPEPVSTYNVVDVTLAPGVPVPEPTRNFYATSSCGICGKASIDAVRTASAYPAGEDPVTVATGTLAALPDRLRKAQRVFDRTGGLHAAGLFSAAGEPVLVREDVGRHNAVDKVVGWAVREGRLPLAGHVLMVSGRASFELVQKAAMAGVPVLAAVSAPSTLAVDLAAESGLTLVGFVRNGRMNVYTAPQRLT